MRAGLGTTYEQITASHRQLVRLAHGVWRPDAVLAWGEPFESPLWESRPEGFAYICRNYACEAPQDTPEGFFRQLTGRDLPPGFTISRSG